jgi:sigma-B regulation protein RsbU (phosphoserine phosphatase)
VTDPYAPETVQSDVDSQLVTDALMDRLLDQVRASMRVDTVAILLFDASEQFLVATAARGIEEEVRQGVRVRAGLGFAGRIAAERRPIVLDEISPGNVVNPLLLRRGIISMLGVPLFREQSSSRHSVLGVLHVGSLVPRKFGAADISALEQAARGVSSAIVRHRSIVDRTAAAALQSSLASRLPAVPGLQLAARYVAGSQYGVGGDWYDVFQLPSGLVGITIGDVMGHGLHAATVMGRARSALRAYALEFDDPAAVLSRLDRKMQHFEPGLIGTVCYATLHPESGAVEISSSGHLPPILAARGGRGHPVPMDVDPPIGVPVTTQRRKTTLRLNPGALLVFYTDGLVERRTADIDAQVQLLCDTMSGSYVSSAEAACAEIMTAMLKDREPEDDVSLLVVSRLAEPDS